MALIDQLDATAQWIGDDKFRVWRKHDTDGDDNDGRNCRLIVSTTTGIPEGAMISGPPPKPYLQLKCACRASVSGGANGIRCNRTGALLGEIVLYDQKANAPHGLIHTDDLD